ncbi:MAG: hypothetical protein RIQ68_1872, partial [Pseudomonadota bacterium]
MAQLPQDILALLNGGPAPQTVFDDSPAMPPMGDVTVSFDQEADPTFEIGENGEVHEVYPDELEIGAQDPSEHTVNLADHIDESKLTSIASDLIDSIEADIEAREPHVAQFERGLERMGFRSDTVDDGPFPGASNVTHPMISEAIVQFFSRAMGELVPPEGPAKVLVIGDSNKAMDDRAQRVSKFLNYKMMIADNNWFAEHARMTMALPFGGDAFKKVYHDPVLQEDVSIFVDQEDFIVPYNVTDLRTAPRFTHRIWRTRNELRKAQAAGVYRDVDLQAPGQEDLATSTQIRLEMQDIETGDEMSDARHELYEVNAELDLPGFEDPQGIARPYLITIDKDSNKVLSIYRGWKANDPLKRRKVNWVHYRFIPGFGFYSLGLFHLIGGLQDAATGSLRAILDGAATSSLQGGFVAKDANLREDRLEIEPGVWKPVDATSEDLAKAFFTPPFKEPSSALSAMLSFLVQTGQKFAATTELQTGTQKSTNAPVGSTLALIEQGQKVFSAIHRGMHMSMAAELRLLYELVQEYMPEGGYPYDIGGAHQGLVAEDFAPGIQITPVSDPNIHSSAQRLAIAQVTYDLATQNPDIIKKEEAVRRVLQAAMVPDIDQLMIEKNPPQPMDPVSEVQALLRGEPVQAYPDQLHEAHLAHLMSFVQNPGFGGNPQVQQQIGPAVTALIGQRLAYLWATHVRAQGVPAPVLPPVMTGEDDGSQGGMPMMGGPMDMPMIAGAMWPPQGGMMPGAQIAPPPNMGQPAGAPPEVIAQMAAQIAPQMAQVPGIPLPPDPKQQAAQDDSQAAQADQQRKNAETTQKLQQADEKHRADMQQRQIENDQKNRAAEAEVQKKEAEAAAKVVA